MEQSSSIDTLTESTTFFSKQNNSIGIGRLFQQIKLEQLDSYLKNKEHIPQPK